MRTVTVTILDDQPEDIRKISDALLTQKWSDLFFELESCTNGSSLKEPYQSELYIIDIEMPGCSGFGIAETILEKCPSKKIIFCTSHDSYVFDSYDLSIFYFVRKEHLKDDLEKAIEKYRKVSSQSLYVLHGRERTDRLIDINQVMYLHTQGNNTLIVCADGEEYIDHHSLRMVSQSFQEIRFCAISSSCVVNFDYVAEIERGRIILADFSHILISATRLSRVKKQYNQFLMEKMI